MAILILSDGASVELTADILKSLRKYGVLPRNRLPVSLDISGLPADLKKEILQCRIEPIQQLSIDEKLKAFRAARPQEEKSITLNSPGVYILHSCKTNLWKIGKTTNFVRRLQSHWSAIPEDVEVVAFYETENLITEWHLHQKYFSNRIKGEWFTLSPDQLSSILASYDFVLINLPISQLLSRVE